MQVLGLTENSLAVNVIGTLEEHQTIASSHDFLSPNGQNLCEKATR